MIASLILGTIAFFVASFYLKRYFDQSDIPAGMTRNVVVFTLALAVSYLVGWVVDHIA